MLSVFIRSVLVISVFVQGASNQLKKLQQSHRSQELTNSEIRYLADLSNTRYTDQVLDNILIPRVVGTSNHEKVFHYIQKELQKLKWNVKVDEFEERAPILGDLTFKNIVATLNPNAERYLILACHYDSKYFENEVFVGATDSAVPCAMMLNLVKVMKKELETIKNRTDLSLMLVFFDGEEAFQNWGPKDSIYGAKHLASQLNRVRSVSTLTGETVSGLDKIDILVLLDLIGHKKTKFYSYFDDTQNWYLKLTTAEDRLTNMNLLEKPTNSKYFLKRAFYGRIEDDHIPFLRKNVPILHLISNPFPDEWHTPGDDRSIIDNDVVEDINKILRVFVVEYLNMSVTN